MFTWEERQETVEFSEWEAFDTKITEAVRRVLDDVETKENQQ
jgi:hypothetical protein